MRKMGVGERDREGVEWEEWNSWNCEDMEERNDDESKTTKRKWLERNYKVNYKFPLTETNSTIYQLYITKIITEYMRKNFKYVKT